MEHPDIKQTVGRLLGPAQPEVELRRLLRRARPLRRARGRGHRRGRGATGSARASRRLPGLPRGARQPARARQRRRSLAAADAAPATHVRKDRRARRQLAVVAGGLDRSVDRRRCDVGLVELHEVTARRRKHVNAAGGEACDAVLQAQPDRQQVSLGLRRSLARREHDDRQVAEVLDGARLPAGSCASPGTRGSRTGSAGGGCRSCVRAPARQAASAAAPPGWRRPGPATRSTNTTAFTSSCVPGVEPGERSTQECPTSTYGFGMSALSISCSSSCTWSCASRPFRGSALPYAAVRPTSPRSYSHVLVRCLTWSKTFSQSAASEPQAREEDDRRAAGSLAVEIDLMAVGLDERSRKGRDLRQLRGGMTPPHETSAAVASRMATLRIAAFDARCAPGRKGGGAAEAAPPRCSNRLAGEARDGERLRAGREVRVHDEQQLADTGDRRGAAKRRVGAHLLERGAGLAAA